MGEPEPAARRPWRTFSVTSVGGCVQGFTATSVAVALPSIAAELAVPGAMVLWIVLSYNVTISALILALGQVADRIDRRRFYLLGLTVFTLASAGAAMAPGGSTLIVMRALQAGGAAVLMCSNVALLTDAFPPSKWGVALGAHVTVSSVAQVLGPVIGGILVTWLGWRSLFWVLVPFGVAGVMWGRIALRGLPQRRTHVRPDVAGSLLSVPVLAGPILALELYRGVPEFDSPAVLLLLPFLLLVGLFLYVEARHPRPVVPVRTFGSRDAFPYLASFLVMAVRSSVVVLLSVYFQVVEHRTAGEAGLLVGLLAFGLVLAAPVAGRLTHLLEVRTLCVGASAVGVLGLCTIVVTVGRDLSDGLAGLGLIIVGIGVGSFMTPNTVMIMRSVNSSRRGRANALRQASQTSGEVLGSGVALVAITVGAGVATGALDTSTFTADSSVYRAVLAVNITMFLGAAVLSWTVGKRGNEDSEG